METLGLRALVRAGLYARDILEDSVTGIFLLVHDGPGHWVVAGAAHGVLGQAGATYR